MWSSKSLEPHASEVYFSMVFRRNRVQVVVTGFTWRKAVQNAPAMFNSRALNCGLGDAQIELTRAVAGVALLVLTLVDVVLSPGLGKQSTKESSATEKKPLCEITHDCE
jgi:hypothetical protein